MASFLPRPLLWGTAISLVLASCQSSQENTDVEQYSADLISIPQSAQGTDSAAYRALPHLVFQDTVHEFGRLYEGEVATATFHFTNQGPQPAIISHASGSCGCTVADYPREPIAPGQGGTIKVKFHTADRSGHQEKSVTLLTNDRQGIHRLYIKAEVASRPEDLN